MAEFVNAVKTPLAAFLAAGVAIVDAWKFHAFGTTADIALLTAALASLGLQAAFVAGGVAIRRPPLP